MLLLNFLLDFDKNVHLKWANKKCSLSIKLNIEDLSNDTENSA